jgi:hypothetical protein
MACVDRKPSSKGTSLKLFCPSAFPEPRAPFVASPFEEAFGRLCPASRRFRPQGLATLSAGLQLLDPLGASFNSQRSWAFPFGALLLLGGRWRVSPLPFALALSSKTFPALDRRSGDLIPPRSRVPFCCPEVLRRGGTFCSLGLWGLSGSPSASARQKASPFPPSPPVLRSLRPRDLKDPEPQGFFSKAAWLSPPEGGAGLFGLFHRLRVPPL